MTHPDLAIDIERIEDRRQPIRDMDAVYIITPKPHIVDCMMAEFDQRRYRGFFLIWTTCENTVYNGWELQADERSAATTPQGAHRPLAIGTRAD